MTEPIQSVEYRKIAVRTSDGATITGKVNISSYERVSDMFTGHGGPFIVLVDVTTQGSTGKTLFLNKDHIVWVAPEDTADAFLSRMEHRMHQK